MKKAFSLIELLISLIIISLITAAFAPIITKKVSGSVLSVTKNFTNINNSENNSSDDNKKDDDDDYVDPSCRKGPNEECCKKFDAQYVSSKNTPGYTGIDLCVLKYNVGDDIFIDRNDNYYHPDYAKIGVQMLNTQNATCNNSPNCCWRGNTASTASSQYNYSGQGRTVCQNGAGKAICANWNPYGSKKGSWRLPTESEMLAFSNAIKQDTASSAKFSRFLDYEGLQFCDRDSTTGANRCNYNYNCTGSTDSYCFPASVWAESYAYDLRSGVFNKYVNGAYAASVRCVNPNPERVINKPEERTAGKDEPKSQKDCDLYDALFIDAKYTGTKNLCMTKYNPGEGNTNFDFGAAGVQLSKGGQTCGLSGSCCWQMNTGTSVSGNYSYSAQDRTVCQRDAAKKLCETYSPKGAAHSGKWRLITQNEFSNLSKYIMSDSINSAFLSKYIDMKGLQLCDRDSSAMGSNRCSFTYNCIGSTDNYCFPASIWTENSYAYDLRSGGFYQYVNGANYAASSRCVTDNINYDHPETKPVGYEPTKNDCDSVDAIFIDRKYTGTKNLCMIRYNPGEGRIPFNFGASGVQLLKGGQPCGLSGSCCWQMNTGTSVSGNYSYSGQDRTVCQRDAAKKLCENWEPGESYGKNWRLPSGSEMVNLVTYFSASGHLSPFLSKYLDVEGLQFCDRDTSAQGSNRCSYTYNCIGSTDNYCFPASVWAENSWAYDFRNGTFFQYVNGANYAASVRCVSDSVRKPSDNNFRTPALTEPRSQIDCEQYNAIFIDAKYTGNTNVCMTKRNFADTEGGVTLGANKPADYSAVGVKLVKAGQSCTGGNCCWSDNTASSIDGIYSYSAYGRTVCQREAARKLCQNYKMGAPSTAWRVPSGSEMDNLRIYLSSGGHIKPYFLFKFQNENGLQFCDRDTSAQGANRCNSTYNCIGATDNYCFPASIWSDNNYAYDLRSGAFFPYVNNPNYAASVRCVTSKVKRVE